ncbi:Uncharacterised protein [Trueperella bialowiezensis]|uniref:Uncharacterized protein n=1 Tax=Trueperella bialowiezensis TaxID=312285 RepID=A0A448PG45_9ACTO|nr:Uncharacterised protein [Trueperella bialowiezensis]
MRTMLEFMDDEMIFEWSYQLQADPRPQARDLYLFIEGYVDQSFR